MPEFTLSTQTLAPVEEVWKLLFDPMRFPEWWTGIETVEIDQPGSYTMWPDGYPDFPMPQLLSTDRTAGRVSISCQVSDIDITWQLAEHGAGTYITVHMALPTQETHRLAGQHQLLKNSLATLARLAESEAAPGAGLAN